jgi:hypothetical protein
VGEAVGKLGAQHSAPSSAMHERYQDAAETGVVQPDRVPSSIVDSVQATVVVSRILLPRQV